jgi:ribosomal protein S18 acetylase RimI-like enzyme
VKIEFRDLEAEDFNRCVEIRGMTRENPIPAEVLREIGVSEETWLPLIEDQSIVGVVAVSGDELVGFCSGDVKSGEVLVLAVLPEYEERSLGKNMLALVAEKLFSQGFDELWLAASPDPKLRAHGFYRHLGWVPTGVIDEHGDEVLEYRK